MNAAHAGLRLMMSLLGLAFDEANRLYWRLAELLVFLVLMVPFGLALNVAGYMEVNIWLSLLLASATMVAWWYPKHAAGVAVLGATKARAEGKNTFGGAKEFMDGYWGILKKVLLVETTVFFYLGFIPFAANPGVFFVVIAGTIVVSLMADQWDFGGGIGKNLAFYGVCVIMSFAVISLIPQGFWGGNNSFFGDWATSIKTKEGGIFVLALLLTVIFTLFDKRSSVAKESKGSYTAIIWLLFGLMDFMFMPPTLHRMWNEYGVGGTKYTQSTETQHTQQTALKRHAVKAMEHSTQNIIVEPGVFKGVSFPLEATLIEDFSVKCPQGCLIKIEHSIMQGEPPVCSSGVYLGEECRVERIVPGVHEGEYRVQEIFVSPKGKDDLDLPHDLRAFILSVASANDERSSVLVETTWSH